jgi:membrane associated rhomboid family serine protease
VPIPQDEQVPSPPRARLRVFSSTPVTWSLIAVNVVVFAITVVVGEDAVAALVLAPDSQQIGNGQVMPGIASGGWWQLITSAFLHAGILHIATNMFSVFVLGRVLEPMLGSGRYLAVYLAGVFAGSAGFLIFADPQDAVEGASGAVFCLVGYLGALALRRRQRQLLFWLLITLLLNAGLAVAYSDISWQGHLGGLVGGLLLGFAMTPPERRLRQGRPIRDASAVAVIMITSVLVSWFTTR